MAVWPKSDLCHNGSTVTMYYMIIQFGSTETNRADVTKRNWMISSPREPTVFIGVDFFPGRGAQSVKTLDFSPEGRGVLSPLWPPAPCAFSICSKRPPPPSTLPRGINPDFVLTALKRYASHVSRHSISTQGRGCRHERIRSVG